MDRESARESGFVDLPQLSFDAPATGRSTGSSPGWDDLPTPWGTYDPYTLRATHGHEHDDQDLPLLPNRRPAEPEVTFDLSDTTSNLDTVQVSHATPVLNEAVYPGEKIRKARPAYLSFDESIYSYPKKAEIVTDFQPELLYTSNPDDPFLSPDNSPAYKRLLLSSRHSPTKLKWGRQRRHPFAQSFEPPNWKFIIIHVVLGVLSYPVLLIFEAIARDKTLFWTRLLVSVGCGLVGFCLGLSLIGLGKAYLEAAAWATLIHQSRVANSPGIPLRDFVAQSADARSAWTALKLLWDRFLYPGTSRRLRRSYDARPWSLYLVFFLAIISISGCLPFILGRIVNINTEVMHQSLKYYEVSIMGDLSEDDINKAAALESAFNDFTLTWTLAPFSTHGSLPAPVAFSYENDTVYFSEATLSQLVTGGSGFGRFDANSTAPTMTTLSSDVSLQSSARNSDIEPGMVLRYPKWGIRIHCTKIPDPAENLIPKSNGTFTYILTPRDTLQDLFSSFSMDFPDILDAPFDASKVLLGNDTLAAFSTGVNLDDIALGAAFYDNGVGHSFKSVPLSMGQDGKGFVTIESVLVRLNTSYTPSGTFALYSSEAIPDATGNPTYIGYDAAVCLELYEPYILETFNSTTGSPDSLRLVDKSAEIADVFWRERNIGKANAQGTRQLKSTNLSAVYDVAHGNSVNQMLKDNGRDSFYVPSPTVISFTGGQGPKGYTELSPAYFAEARGLADASNVLPYFSGTGALVARAYPDLTLSTAKIDPILMLAFVAAVLLLGVTAGIFVPRLPLNIPRRGFEGYSWLAAFHGDNIAHEVQRTGMVKNMELGEIERRMGDMKVKYVWSD